MNNAALLAAGFSAKVTRLVHGHRVDVLRCSPNLIRLPIHDAAFKEGKIMTLPFSSEHVNQLEADLELSLHFDAFVGRFNSPPPAALH